MGVTDSSKTILEKTAQQWHKDTDGNSIYDSLIKTGEKLDFKQGKYPGYKGTCELVSCENIMRLAGINVNEEQVVKYAIDKSLCETGSKSEADRGGTTVESRNKLLVDFGIPCKDEPVSVNNIAKRVESLYLLDQLMGDKYKVSA